MENNLLSNFTENTIVWYNVVHEKMKHTFVDYKIEAELQDTVLRWVFLFKFSQETKCMGSLLKYYSM